MKIFFNITTQKNTLNKNIKTEIQQADSKPLKESFPVYSPMFMPVFCSRRSLYKQLSAFKPGEIPLSAYNLAQKVVRDPRSNDRIYQIHQKAYSPLKDCKTLDEAKALFVEFQDVINVSQVNKEEYTPRGLISRIKKGEFEQLSEENASLIFLKKLFCDMIPPSKQDEWFGFNYKSLKKLLNQLHIKVPCQKYFLAYMHTEPAQNEKISQAIKAHYKNNPEAAKNAAEKRIQYLKSHPESAIKQYYDQNPEALKITKMKNKQFYIDHPEAVQERRECSKRWYDEHGKKIKACYDLTWAQHEDIRQLMKDVAKNEFPLLSEVFKKNEKNIALTPIEQAYLQSYHKRCEELCPNKSKRIGETFHKIWTEQFKDKS